MTKEITQEDKAHYEKLHTIAYNFSFDTDNNQNDAIVFLIKSYEGLIWKFINEVKNDQLINIKDRKIRNFYKLYIKKEELGNGVTVHQYNRSIKARSLLQQRSVLIADLLTLVECEDLYQESVIRILTLADRYKDNEKASFHTYVDRVFHYEFYRVVKNNAPKNFNVYNDLEVMDYDYDDKYINQPDSDNDIKEVDQHLHDMSQVNNCDEVAQRVFKSLFSDEFFNINWINGITAGEVFKTLNFLERKILKLYYIKGLTDKQVGNELGFSRIVINKRRNEAKKEILKLAQKENRVK